MIVLIVALVSQNVPTLLFMSPEWLGNWAMLPTNSPHPPEIIKVTFFPPIIFISFLINVPSVIHFTTNPNVRRYAPWIVVSPILKT